MDKIKVGKRWARAIGIQMFPRFFVEKKIAGLLSVLLSHTQVTSCSVELRASEVFSVQKNSVVNVLYCI